MNENIPERKGKLKEPLLTAEEDDLMTTFDTKILTYNIFLRPPPVKNNEDDFKNERLKEFLKLIKYYDIICLQEVFGFLNHRKHKLIKNALKSGFLYFAESPSPSFFSTFLVDGGLLTLSRFPIVASEFKPFKYCVMSDSLSNKGVLYTKINMKGEILHLFNTHTQATYYKAPERDIRSTVRTRADHFLEIRKHIDDMLMKNKYSERDMVLLIGDLNVDARSPIFPRKYVDNIEALRAYYDQIDVYDEYEGLLHIMSDNQRYKIIDLLKSNYGGESPPTYGEFVIDEHGAKVPVETVLTHKEDVSCNHCLDYFLQIIPNRPGKRKASDSETGPKMYIDKRSVRVEKFMMEHHLFSQLSDHYGLSARVILFKGNEEKQERSQALEDIHDKNDTVDTSLLKEIRTLK